jgi:hypothetical protein
MIDTYFSCTLKSKVHKIAYVEVYNNCIFSFFYKDFFHLISIKTIKEKANSFTTLVEHIIFSIILKYKMVEKDLELSVLKIMYMIVNQVLFNFYFYFIYLYYFL